MYYNILHLFMLIEVQHSHQAKLKLIWDTGCIGDHGFIYPAYPLQTEHQYRLINLQRLLIDTAGQRQTTVQCLNFPGKEVISGGKSIPILYVNQNSIRRLRHYM